MTLDLANFEDQAREILEGWQAKDRARVGAVLREPCASFQL